MNNDSTVDGGDELGLTPDWVSQLLAAQGRDGLLDPEEVDAFMRQLDRDQLEEMKRD